MTWLMRPQRRELADFYKKEGLPLAGEVALRYADLLASDPRAAEVMPRVAKLQEFFSKGGQGDEATIIDALSVLVNAQLKQGLDVQKSRDPASAEKFLHQRMMDEGREAKREQSKVRSSLLGVLQQKAAATEAAVEQEAKNMEDALFENPSLSPSMKKRALSVAAMLDKMPKSATITQSMLNDVWRFITGTTPKRKR